MILFGTSVGFPEKLHKYAVPGIQFSMGDEKYGYLAQTSVGRVCETYQQILEIARAMPDVEALVFLHDDLELRDPKFATKIRAALDIGWDIIGLVGTTKITSLRWWEHGPSTWRGYAEDGRNGRTVVDGGFAEGDPCHVASVDGMLFAMSRRAIDNVDFHPEIYKGIHAYAEECCFQARDKGMRVGVTRIEAFHATHGGYAGGEAAFEEANVAFKRRWGLG